MTFDTVIRGGTVIDGTGSAGTTADVGISGGHIAEIGPRLAGRTTLDASGCVVAPGFIDVHTHYDAQVFWDPALTPSSWHGVTTVVAGNCGFSLAPCRPEHRDLIRRTLQRVEDMDAATVEAGVAWEYETFPEYLDVIERRGIAINYTAYVGHTAVRLYVMGEAAYERESATPAELDAMAAIVREGLLAGAAGFASSSSPTHAGDGGRPVPSRLAGLAEVERLLEPLRDLRRGVAQFTVGDRIQHKDLYELQPRIGRPFSWSALLSVDGSDMTNQLRTLNQRGRAVGADVWPQVSCRPLSMQVTMDEPFSFNVAPSFKTLMGTSRADRIRAYNDPAWRRRAEQELEAVRVLQERWETISIAESNCRPTLQGRTVSDVAGEWGVSPLDVMLDISLEDDLRTRFKTILANSNDAVVTQLLNEDGVLLGLSDAGAHVSQLCDACLPTDLLGNWVRDRNTMSLERAIHKLTGEPARVFGFGDRGVLAPGFAADIVVFDPTTIGPGPLRRICDFPANGERLVADAPQGIRHVLVNGAAIRADGDPNLAVIEARPGRVLGRSQRS